MEYKHIVVLITAPSDEAARRVAKTLVEKKLATCVNIVVPVRSIYTWEGEICDDEEAQLIQCQHTRPGCQRQQEIPASVVGQPYLLSIR